MEAFLLSLGLIFVAELGDKTQLVALTLATRFNAWVVLAGVFVATLLVHAFSVVLGEITGSLLSPGWLQLLCGLAFIGFGLWTLRGDMAEDGNSRINRLKSPFVIVTLTFFLAELGDKTMLATVTLAAKISGLTSLAGFHLGDGPLRCPGDLGWTGVEEEAPGKGGKNRGCHYLLWRWLLLCLRRRQ